jgi:hypothetical protein
MGYNTIVFLLNDFMHTLENSPKTVLWEITHPPLPFEDEDVINTQIENVARRNNELLPHFQAITVLPTFHADQRKFFVAGGNCIEELTSIKFSKINGKNTVTLELPEWWDYR